jgi:hypothetical protein
MALAKVMTYDRLSGQDRFVLCRMLHEKASRCDNILEQLVDAELSKTSMQNPS